MRVGGAAAGGPVVIESWGHVQVVVAHGRLHDLERTVGALRSELDRLLSHLRGV